MRKIKNLCLIVLLIFLVTDCGQPKVAHDSMRRIVDMAGRTVEIPEEIKTVYSTGPIGTVFMYTLAPEKLAGWNHELKDVTKRYIKKEYHDLPALGTWRGMKYDGNVEELLKVKPDLIINMGDVGEEYISDSDEIQKQLGIPVLMVDGRIENSAAAYRFLGDILDVEERAEKLAIYCDQTLNDVQSKISAIPDDQKIRLYYAEGLKGLETQAKGSLNSEILELSGAYNVADPGLEENVRRMEVSFEQLLKWDPEIIILSTDGDQSGELFNTIMGGGVWESLTAVKNNQVYEIPNAPYDWINRPPSVNRIIGIRWLANLLYPEICEVDIKEEVEEFFSLFYQYDLSTDEIDSILRRSLRR